MKLQSILFLEQSNCFFLAIFIKQQEMKKQIEPLLQHCEHLHFPPKMVCGFVAFGHSPNKKSVGMELLQKHLMSLMATCLNFANSSVRIGNIVALAESLKVGETHHDF